MVIDTGTAEQHPRVRLPEHAGLLVVETEPAPLLDAIAAWTPPPLGAKWIDRR